MGARSFIFGYHVYILSRQRIESSVMETILKNVYIPLLLCAQLATPAIGQANQIQVDNRIAPSSALMLEDFWDKQNPPKRDIMPMCYDSILNTPGGMNAFRAQELALYGHFDEALAEITKALECKDDQWHMKLRAEPGWWLFRAETV